MILFRWQKLQETAIAFKERLCSFWDQQNWCKAPWVEATGLVLLALCLNLIGNNQTSLWDRDEPRYAQCAREMRESGDFIDPSFNGEPRYQKPILSYWMIQVGVALCGDTPFGNRLMSAMFGAATSLLVWHLGRSMLGPNAGRIAAFAMATSPLVIIESKLATTDACLGFFITLGYMALWHLVQRPSPKWAAILWVSLALSILTKGPVGPAFLLLSGAIWWLWCDRPRVEWGRTYPRWGIPLFLCLVLPWFLAIAWKSRGEFFQVAVGQQLMERALHPLESHGAFPGYYVATVLLSFFPWSVFLPMGAGLLTKARKSQPGLGFLLGWTLGPLLLLELFHTKLIHYYMPAVGGCALLVGWTLDQVASSEQNLRRWRFGRLALGLLTGIGLVAAVMLLAGVALAPSNLWLPMIVVSMVIVAMVLVATEDFRRAAAGPAWQTLAAGSAAVFLLIGGWLLPCLEPYRLTPQVASKLADVCKETSAQPMLWTFQPPGIIYQFGKPIPIRRDIAWMDKLVRDTGAVAAPLLDWEIEALEKDPGLSLERLGEIKGLHIERGKTQTVELVLIRPSAKSVLDRPGSDIALGQKPLIK